MEEVALPWEKRGRAPASNVKTAARCFLNPSVVTQYPSALSTEASSPARLKCNDGELRPQYPLWINFYVLHRTGGSNGTKWRAKESSDEEEAEK